MINQTIKVTMLIRCPVADAFDAFIDPNTITKFWLADTSGPLAEGAKVDWSFMVPGATDTVTVTEFQHQRRIGFEWSDGTPVIVTFAKHGKDAVRVAIEASGFNTDGGIDEIVNTTEGFSIVLCDLKTLLESGRSANLVRDKAELITTSLNDSKDNA